MVFKVKSFFLATEDFVKMYLSESEYIWTLGEILTGFKSLFRKKLFYDSVT